MIFKPTTLYLFSDGFQDQLGGPKRKKFFSRRFRKLLLEIHALPMDEQEQILEQTIEDWMQRGREAQVDDITVIGLRLSHQPYALNQTKRRQSGDFASK